MNYESRHGLSRTHHADGSRQRDIRREEAELRQAKRDGKTPEQQLNELDRKLGKNTGAIKERLRLHRLISEQPTKKADKTRKEKKKARRNVIKL